MHVTCRTTRALDRACREEVIELARARGVPAEYLESRWSRYSHVALLHRDGVLLAVQLLARRRGLAEPTLVYLGPLVSRESAFFLLFRALATRWARETHGFYAMAELESARVHTSLHAVLPSFVLRPDARALALVERFRGFVDHVVDFDPRTFTSACVEPMRVAETASRHRVVLFGCAPHRRARFLDELHGSELDAREPLRRSA